MVKSFELPGLNELVELGAQERLNVFRRFFASSRYGRLLIQQILVRSAVDHHLMQQVIAMERDHNRSFEDMLSKVADYGFLEEFMAAAKEEETALQKIIEAYDKRMGGRM